MPPFQSTIARASDDAKCMVEAKRPLRRAALTVIFLCFSVSAVKDLPISSSMTRVFIVRAPVIPSLKAPVITEFCSLISRLSFVSLAWKKEKSRTVTGRTASTRSASLAFKASMTALAPTR